MPESNNQPQITHAVIVAAGRGERSGLDLPKQYETIGGKPMIRHSVESFLTHGAIDKLWIVIGDGQDELLAKALNGLSDYQVVIGGPSRQQSVFNGLSAIAAAGGANHVLIHDAARPFLSHDVIDRLNASFPDHKAVIPILPAIDTMVQAADGFVDNTLDRNSIWRVQTPQAFAFPPLWRAHQSAAGTSDATDDAQIMKAAGHAVATVQGDEKLLKYTNPADFGNIGKTMKQTRIGMGYDVHQLVSGEELWLGGLQIEHDKGLSGHSDADVLLHALTDALLGAIGAGDIGDHFPPSDPHWSGAASHKFVEHAVSLINQKGGIIQNVDMTLICEAPKIKPHREAMRLNIAKMLDLSTDQVSVKATTTEGPWFYRTRRRNRRTGHRYGRNGSKVYDEENRNRNRNFCIGQRSITSGS